jgi:hypothetical protein
LKISSMIIRKISIGNDEKDMAKRTETRKQNRSVYYFFTGKEIYSHSPLNRATSSPRPPTLPTTTTTTKYSVCSPSQWPTTIMMRQVTWLLTLSSPFWLSFSFL